MAPVRSILIGYDGFDRDEGISSAAIEIARNHGAKVHVLHVAPPEPPRPWRTAKVSSTELHAALLESREKRLRERVKELAEPDLDIQASVRSGVPQVELIRQAVALDVDLIVVTDEPQYRDGRRGFGVVTSKLLRKSPVPVLALRDHREWTPRRVVAALDVEPSSEQDDTLNLAILEMAGLLARSTGAGLVVFHAWRLWGKELLRGRMSKDELRDLLKNTEDIRISELERLMASTDLSGVDVEVTVKDGDAEKLLLGMSERGEMDILVMGTLRRTGLPGLVIGNSAERIINKLGCAIVALKPPGFVTPIDTTGGSAGPH